MSVEAMVDERTADPVSPDALAAEVRRLRIQVD